ncbi:MBL fold metallo-hydrolase [Synechococcus sp. R55.3]|uniref:MBL fold metallo-hydrolase n=1 Tax=Synechococcus sp. R55.3 TaxID=2969647 RepID=UPI0039C06983
MKRRQLLQASAGLLGSMAVNLARGRKAGAQTAPAQGSETPTTPGSIEFTPGSSLEGLQLTWLHHSCVLFEGEGQRFLVNPFRPAGCTAGYPAPRVAADLVLLSSRLLDEGALDVVPGNPRVLFQPGDYLIDGIRVQGVRMPRGPRFGVNVGWRWRMAGIDIVHLGGAALPITREQSILLSRPDLLLVPVGGGPKNYDPAGAKAAIEALQPKLVIPTMYRTVAAADSQCDLVPLQAFLSLFPAAAVQPAASNPLILSAQALPSRGMVILAFEE